MNKSIWLGIVITILPSFVHADKEWTLGGAVTIESEKVQQEIFCPGDISVYTADGKTLLGIYDSTAGEYPQVFRNLSLVCGITIVGINNVEKVDGTMTQMANPTEIECKRDGKYRWFFSVKTADIRAGVSTIVFRIYHKDAKSRLRILLLTMSSRKGGKVDMGFRVTVQDAPEIRGATQTSIWQYLRGFIPAIASPGKYVAEDLQKIQQEYEQKLLAKQAEADVLNEEKKVSVSKSELAIATKKCQEAVEERDALRSQLDEIKREPGPIVQSAFTDCH